MAGVNEITGILFPHDIEQSDEAPTRHFEWRTPVLTGIMVLLGCVSVKAQTVILTHYKYQKYMYSIKSKINVI